MPCPYTFGSVISNLRFEKKAGFASETRLFFEGLGFEHLELKLANRE